MRSLNSLRTKMVLIMVLLILALMTVAGAFLINGVGNFYIEKFYDAMEDTFSKSFILQLREIEQKSENPPARMKELLMAQSDLNIDLTTRNVYILDKNGHVMDSSDQKDSVAVTANLLTAMNGSVGESSSITSEYMDLAIPIKSGGSMYIVYILDNKATVNALTSEVLSIILRALALGVVICVVLAILLARILITPIRALSDGTQQVAAGDFSQKLEVTSHDEIGVLTRNFNHMAKVLQNTLSEVENERTKLSTLFLHMTDGVVAFNNEGHLIHYNPAATQMLSRSLDVAMTFWDLFAGDADFKQLLKLKRPQFLECTKKTESRELEVFLAPFAAAQSQGGALAVIHDVTEQRKNEETRREFVANVSHELRTPLTNIKSYAETIVSGGDELPNEVRTNFMGVIINETDRMTRIVRDLLTLSKLDSGKMEMSRSKFSFVEAVENVCAAESIDAKNHRHALNFQGGQEPLVVNGDRERIEQVVMNIISNAIKYTPDGGEINVVTGTRGHNAFVRITDNGIGIPEKDLPRLFERFYRVDKARSRESGGTGLGLSIAREILLQHKGNIQIDSVYGKGTEVLITLPRAAE